ncbi:MAG: M36 family metallopeptidase, partial [Saprospiraceae bacterium]|nr:M36 family metallopeptidase [Saprospiraceae bacterium]
YGFDPDIMNGSGGNNMAVQLVMDGMKYQVCNRGFVDGRDAILLADEILYNGANQCLIWEVFARRGLGYFADQGSSDNAADGTESYEALPTCIKELKITKAVTPLITAGDDVTVTLNIVNHKEDAVSDIVISDELPEGMSFLEIESTTGIDKANIDVNTTVPGVVSFTWNENGSTGLGTLEEASITYRLATSPDKFSVRMYFDDIPDNSFDTEDRWLIGIESDQDNSPNIWMLTEGNAHSGDWAWNVDDNPLDTRQVLELFEDLPLTGTTPVIRFYHNYDAFPGRHGGVFEISTDGGTSFQNSEERFIRNGYTGQIIYQAFTIPDFYAFFGQSGEFVDSYVDVSDLAGSDIRIRYRFGTQDTTEFSSGFNPAYYNYFGSNQGGTGWTVDDFELMDLFTYNGEVCITSEEGDNVCTKAANRGTIVDSQEASDVKDLGAETSVAVYPNPAANILTFSFEAKENQSIDIQIVSLEGKLVQQMQRKIYQGTQAFSIDVSMLPEGFYFVKMQSGDDFLTEKVLIQR